MTRRRVWTAAAFAVSLLALTSCTPDEPATPAPAPTPSTSPMPATAAETAQAAFSLLVAYQQDNPRAVGEACAYFDADAYRIGPDPDEYGYENAEGGPTPDKEWPDVPMARWCGEGADPIAAPFPEPLGKYALDGTTPTIEEETRNEDGSRWVRVQFQGQTGMEPVAIERVAAVEPQDDGTWRIERWCYVPLDDADGRYADEVEDPFTCLRRTS